MAISTLRFDWPGGAVQDLRYRYGQTSASKPWLRAHVHVCYCGRRPCRLRTDCGSAFSKASLRSLRSCLPGRSLAICKKIAPSNVLLRYTNERGVGLSFGQLSVWLRAVGEADVGNKCRKLWPSLRTLNVSVSVFLKRSLAYSKAKGSVTPEACYRLKRS